MSRNNSKQLSDGQIACLRLVSEHYTSKEIARKLDISPFTVDQRLDAARKKLGAENRKAAAKIFAKMDAANIPERLVYEPDEIAPQTHLASVGLPTSDRGYRDNSSDGTLYSIPNQSEYKSNFWSSVLSIIRVPPIGGGRHKNSITEILLQALNIAFYAAILVGIIAILLSGAMSALS